MKNTLSAQVSCFKDYYSSDPVTITLEQWLRSEKHYDKMISIRNTQDKTVRDALKSKLPAITPSGVFSDRKDTALIKHSGFIQFDIDEKENQGIDLAALKVDIMKLQTVAYCGWSVSGRGLWGLVRIAYPDKHREHFYAMDRAFAYLGVNIDKSCKNLSRLRGYSYDPDGQYNYGAIAFTRTTDKIKQNTIASSAGKEHFRVKRCIDNLNGTDITGRYEDWFAIGCALANEFSEGGRTFYHEVSKYHVAYEPVHTDKQYDKCLDHRYDYSIATFFEICKQNNVFFSNERSTDSDKFRIMAAKNPAMIRLRDTFDLVGSDMKELAN